MLPEKTSPLWIPTFGGQNTRSRFNVPALPKNLVEKVAYGRLSS